MTTPQSAEQPDVARLRELWRSPKLQDSAHLADAIPALLDSHDALTAELAAVNELLAGLNLPAILDGAYPTTPMGFVAAAQHGMKAAQARIAELEAGLREVVDADKDVRDRSADIPLEPRDEAEEQSWRRMDRALDALPALLTPGGTADAS